MLSENDFNHLKLLYEQYLRVNKHIRELSEKKDWESVEAAVKDKEIMLNNIVQFEKPRLDEIKQDEFLNNFRIKLIELEKDNLNFINNAKDKLLLEMNNIKHSKKILNTYEPSTNEITSTLDVKSDD